MNDGAKSNDCIPGRRLHVGRPGRWRLIARIAALVVAATVVFPAPAFAQKARVTGFSDVNFGILSNFASDARQSQSLCMYSQTDVYNVWASGSGAGGDFTLSNGGNTLAYEVQWNATSGQTSGSTLAPNTTLTGQATTATHQTCNNGPPTTASLIIVLRSVALSGATAGSYTGTLTVVVAPE